MISEKITLEDCRSLTIEKLITEALIKFKKAFVENKLNLNGQEIGITSTKTRFRGSRFWFVCPSCKHRASKLYIHPLSQQIGCQKCLNLLYRKQRFKGMIEGENLL